MLRYVQNLGRTLKRYYFDSKYGGRFRGHDFDSSFRCDNFHNFIFGLRCYIGPNCHFDALGGIDIDDFVIIGPSVCIWSYNHDFGSEVIPYGPENNLRPVRIGKGCWIGLNALILPGAEIGEGSVVAAGSIVRGTVPPFSMVRPVYSTHAPLDIKKNPKTYYRDLQ